MKIFSSELAHNYGSYTFGYANYGELEADDSLATIYNAGFLPYSGSPEARGILYMARSARVELAAFERSSENRRVSKKFDGAFAKIRVPIGEFEADEAFYDFCLKYFAARHGEQAMPRERLQYIIESPFVSHIVTYHEHGIIVAYVFVMRENDIEHYWFSFYDIALAQQSLGLWLMLDCIEDAKAAGLAYYYLGTVYGEKALYKTNFEPLEWWDGSAWQTDSKALRQRARLDDGRALLQKDFWKENRRLF